MGFLDRLLGREESADREPANRPTDRSTAASGAPVYGSPDPAQRRAEPRSEDEIAIERYRYLLRTAPPETIEQVHAEAFAKLTPEQRRQVYQELSANAAPGEQPRSEEPSALAQAATRNELRQPGTLERSFGGGGGMGFGGMLATSMLGTIAGVVVGSAIAQAFLPDPGAAEAGGAEGDGSGDTGADGGAEASADAGGYDAGADAGGGFDGGFGGGDFGGGDFGGGDFGGGFDF